jgi:hypothetical protein
VIGFLTEHVPNALHLSIDQALGELSESDLAKALQILDGQGSSGG